MTKRWFAAALLVPLTLSGGVAAAGDSAAGKAKADVCAGCHGLNGISSNPEWPNLAGQQGAYLIRQIKAYRDGQRQDPLMSPIVQNLKDSDIADLAAYYLSLKNCP